MNFKQAAIANLHFYSTVLLCIALSRYLRSLNLKLKGKKPSFYMKTGFLSNY
ncbi:hypothetical protein [Nostoc sp. DedQUE07]|uniref:hypothetical protein n=1 Tax=Nostoc sp. DedQUE07 TaxID=3075392 RepID=UPI002AD69804|nr:hypothetical protein [Nostoc sp. DedQUE07]